jgi:deltex-like protein
MSVRTTRHQCPGFDAGTTSLEITYEIPSGIQLPYHDHPGRPYAGTTRVAYVPDNAEGRDLLRRLCRAFARGVTFAVGTSFTTGRTDVAVWTSIHHKTSLSGGSHGFPDDRYLTNCHAELDAAGVPATAACDAVRKLPLRLHYHAPPTLKRKARTNDLVAAASATTATTTTATTGTAHRQHDCTLCYNALAAEPALRIRSCRHVFHESCLMTHCGGGGGRTAKTCPTCQVGIGVPPAGRCPSGTMTIRLNGGAVCPGYSTTTTVIEITYHVPDGQRQAPYHDQPGRSIPGTTRVAYLPNNREGRELLTRIKYAWRRGLIFTVGTSLTTGRTGVVCWSGDVPHKTSLSPGRGGGPFSYPDPHYLDHCHHQLDVLGVPAADDCP